MANVRFYRLGTLPNYANATHQGVFVHLIPTEGETHKAGLWFGGNAGWEYLTNDTDAINAAIDAKIQELDVPGYAQATITTNTPDEGEDNSTLTISGIKEVNGKISIDNDNDKKLEVAIDGKYDKEGNKIATQTTVKNAINNLDVNTIQAVTFNTSADNGNTTLTFKGIKEVDGIISQGDEQTPDTFIVGDAKLKIQIGSDEAGAFEVFSANAKGNKSIFLDGNVFKKNVDGDKNVLSIYTTEGVSSTNPLVTQKDIASLGGAMHYKGPVSSLDDFNRILGDSDAEEAGNVYIATGDFTHVDNVISTGDMIVFNGPNNYNVIQSNITLGTGVGQVAANSAALSKDKIVVASENGIETIDFDKTNLTDTTGKNERTLSVTNGTINDNGFHHAVTISDTFKVIGKDFSKSINITSNNRSIDIAQNGNTGVMVDLVWNTTMDSDLNN